MDFPGRRLISLGLLLTFLLRDASLLGLTSLTTFGSGECLSTGQPIGEVGEECHAALLVHDIGRSINPAIDRGQVEGGFVQGMGWLTMEECIWDRQGRLLTHGPSTYKIPVASDAPPVFNAWLWERGENMRDIVHRSKAVGEPPLLLPFSVFYAIRDAVSAVGGHRVDPPLAAPATMTNFSPRVRMKPLMAGEFASTLSQPSL